MGVWYWLGLHPRNNWKWITNAARPSLELKSPLRPGWYMLTIQIQSEQQRCYGVFNGTQARLLISGRRRRRLVRVARQQGKLELVGINGVVNLKELRLIRQPFWRVRRLIKSKLVAMHPAYSTTCRRSLSINKLWGDYNRLLGKRVHPLVGYDAWIEQVERPSFQNSQPLQQRVLTFAIWLYGDRNKSEACQRSIASLGRQWQGDYRLLEPSQQLHDAETECWVVPLRVGDVLAPQALERLTAVIKARPEAAVIYSDEDCINTTGRRHSPQFKPAWNPDLLYSDPHYSHIWCLRSDIYLNACQILQVDRQQLEIYGLVLEATHQVRPDQVVHLPEVLYHRQDNATGLRGTDASMATLKSFFRRRQQPLSVTNRTGGGHVLHWPLPAQPPDVTVIIPTRNQGAMLRRCIESVISHDDGKINLDIIVIDNDSRDDETLSYLTYLRTLAQVQVHSCPGPFNYAAINNEAVALARGELIAFINNDVEATHDGWLSTMAAQACRSEVGAVGARLLYPDGTIQHGGVVLGIGGIAGHAHKYFSAEADGYQLRLQLAQNMSAVTAAALVIRRCCFEQVGGFDAESFAVNYNDVDLCLRLMAAGYRNLYCPEAVLIHHESKSRGVPIEGDNRYRQWQQERLAMVNRWGELLMADPCYSPHLSLVEENLSLALHGTMGTTGRTCSVGW